MQHKVHGHIFTLPPEKALKLHRKYLM